MNCWIIHQTILLSQVSVSDFKDIKSIADFCLKTSKTTIIFILQQALQLIATCFRNYWHFIQCKSKTSTLKWF